jgi:hypothetical protein
MVVSAPDDAFNFALAEKIRSATASNNFVTLRLPQPKMIDDHVRDVVQSRGIAQPLERL